MDEFSRLKHRLEVEITPQCKLAIRHIPHTSKAVSQAEIERIREILGPLGQLDLGTVPVAERRVFRQSVRGLLDFLEQVTVDHFAAPVREDIETAAAVVKCTGSDANALRQRGGGSIPDPVKADRMQRWVSLFLPDTEGPKMPGAWPEGCH